MVLDHRQGVQEAPCTAGFQSVAELLIDFNYVVLLMRAYSHQRVLRVPLVLLGARLALQRPHVHAHRPFLDGDRGDALEPVHVAPVLHGRAQHVPRGAEDIEPFALHGHIEPDDATLGYVRRRTPRAQRHLDFTTGVRVDGAARRGALLTDPLQ